MGTKLFQEKLQFVSKGMGAHWAPNHMSSNHYYLLFLSIQYLSSKKIL